MLLVLVILLVACIGFVCGYFVRELREILKRVQKALYVLLERHKKEEEKEKKMGYASPMTMEELKQLDDEAQIQALNER